MFSIKDEELLKKVLQLYRLMVDTNAMQIPFVQAVFAFVYFYLMVPSQTMKLGYIGQFAECSVGLGGIPTQFALETDFFHNLFGHFTDGDFFSCTYIDVQLRISLLPSG